MKRTIYIFIVGLFLTSICLPTLILHQVHKRVEDTLQHKIEYLLNEGYSKHAATHIAKVELGYIQADAEYIALMED